MSDKERIDQIIIQQAKMMKMIMSILEIIQGGEINANKDKAKITDAEREYSPY